MDWTMHRSRCLPIHPRFLFFFCKSHLPSIAIKLQLPSSSLKVNMVFRRRGESTWVLLTPRWIRGKKGGGGAWHDFGWGSVIAFAGDHPAGPTNWRWKSTTDSPEADAECQNGEIKVHVSAKLRGYPATVGPPPASSASD